MAGSGLGDLGAAGSGWPFRTHCLCLMQLILHLTPIGHKWRPFPRQVDFDTSRQPHAIARIQAGVSKPCFENRADGRSIWSASVRSMKWNERHVAGVGDSRGAVLARCNIYACVALTIARETGSARHPDIRYLVDEASRIVMHKRLHQHLDDANAFIASRRACEQCTVAAPRAVRVDLGARNEELFCHVLHRVTTPGTTDGSLPGAVATRAIAAVANSEQTACRMITVSVGVELETSTVFIRKVRTFIFICDGGSVCVRGEHVGMCACTCTCALELRRGTMSRPLTTPQS